MKHKALKKIEGGKSTQKVNIQKQKIKVQKLHVAIKVTEELLYDNAFGLENYIIEEFGKALANAEEDAFLNGTCVGQTLGLFAENGGGQVAKSVAKQTAWREKSFQAVIFFIIFQKSY